MSKARVTELRERLISAVGDFSRSVEFDVFFSALVDYNPFNSTDDVLEWLQDLNRIQYFEVEEIGFSHLQQWHFDDLSGDLRHNKGKFFSIRGFQVFDNLTGDIFWDQPIIDQPEIGILGILGKKIDGVLYFLMQAKAEPGNINTYQLSPTVQATRSNYTLAHGGKKTIYLEYFNGKTPVKVLYDQYQSEQGARFLEKRNRNIIVLDESNTPIKLSPNHKWLTLGQIKSLMEHDNTVNMDSRSVISLIRYWDSKYQIDVPAISRIISDYSDVIKRSEFWLSAVLQCFESHESNRQLSEIRIALNRKRYCCKFGRKAFPLKDLRDWSIGDRLIQHNQNKFFQILAVRINANNREVESWDQPIMRQRHHAQIGLICSLQKGVYMFLVQMKTEPGLYDMVELSPTVQCIAENYETGKQPRYLDEFHDKELICQARQSEEGGRFYRECNLNMIREASGFENTDPENYLWISLANMKEMVQTQRMLNVELRSLLAYF